MSAVNRCIQILYPPLVREASCPGRCTFGRIICVENDEFCIQNDEFCIENDELFIQNVEFCINDCASDSHAGTRQSHYHYLSSFRCKVKATTEHNKSRTQSGSHHVVQASYSVLEPGRPKTIIFQGNNPHFLLSNLHFYIKDELPRSSAGLPWTFHPSSPAAIRERSINRRHVYTSVSQNSISSYRRPTRQLDKRRR